jgi:hypothetical protein
MPIPDACGQKSVTGLSSHSTELKGAPRSWMVEILVDAEQLQLLRHEHRFVPRGSSHSLRLDGESALPVELDRVRRHIGREPFASFATCEVLNKCQQHSTMSLALDVSTNGHPANHGNSSRHIDADDANHIATVPQQLGMIAGHALVRTVLVVDAEQSSRLEQDTAANVVIRTPLVCFDRRNQRVIGGVHAPSTAS